MPGSSTASFTDAAQYAAGLTDIFTSVTQLGPNDFAAHVNRAALRHMRLMQVREQVARVANVALPLGVVFISFAAARHSPIIWRGRALAPDELMLHGHGEHLHQRTDGPSQWGMLSMSPARLKDVCKTENGRDFTPLPAGQIIRPRPRDRQGLHRVHAQASRLAETRPAILGNPGVVRAMEQEFEGLLARCLIDGEIRPEPPAAAFENDLMQRFETSLASCPQRSPGIREWATSLGVSTGTLNQVCLAFLGVSPRRYAQLRQLAQARIAIRSAGPGTARIADLARLAGFADPARFAALYKAAFGETPSGTLRRAGTA